MKRWDYETRKLYLRTHYITDEGENTTFLELAVSHSSEMVTDFLEKLKNNIKLNIDAKDIDIEQVEIDFANESLVRQKLYSYLRKVFADNNNTKMKKGKGKRNIPSYVDLYFESQDLSFLPTNVQFYIVMNWAKKYYDREDFLKAIEPLRKLIKIKPDFGLAYKWLARCLKKNRKYDEAMRSYEKYAKVDKSLDAYLDLAKSYRKGKLFEKSEKIYHKILRDYPDEKEAKIGLAQIKYAHNNLEYFRILEQLSELDSEWLKKWLLEEFNFRIYISNKTLLTPNQASNYLGYEKAFQLTQMAFRNEVPSHFNPAKARISFFKEELDNWAKVMNRFQLLPEEVKLFPDAISTKEAEVVSTPERKQVSIPEKIESKRAETQSTKVEEIIRRIRERKALRKVQANFMSTNDKNNTPHGALDSSHKSKKIESDDPPEVQDRLKDSLEKSKSKEIHEQDVQQAGKDKEDNIIDKEVTKEKIIEAHTKKRKKTKKKKSSKVTLTKKSNPVDLPTEAEIILETDNTN